MQHVWLNYDKRSQLNTSSLVLKLPPIPVLQADVNRYLPQVYHEALTCCWLLCTNLFQTHMPRLGDNDRAVPADQFSAYD